MKYYKLIEANTFIGIVHSGAFVEENSRSHKLRISTEIQGQFVEYDGILYRDYWMAPILSDSTKNFRTVTIEEITKTEYDAIMDTIRREEEVIIEDDDNNEDDVIVIEPDEPDVTVEYVRELKLKEINATCKNTIENGFDIELRGETKHFSLTTQDQLNLMSLSIAAQTEQLIPYHADGEECMFYTAEEINQIISTATSFKNYQLAYHNALKAYINTLDSVEVIGAITYGTPIPDEYKSDVLMILE